jgi:PAS domain S-box-containing protein
LIQPLDYILFTGALAMLVLGVIAWTRTVSTAVGNPGQSVWGRLVGFALLQVVVHTGDLFHALLDHTPAWTVARAVLIPLSLVVLADMGLVQRVGAASRAVALVVLLMAGMVVVAVDGGVGHAATALLACAGGLLGAVALVRVADATIDRAAIWLRLLAVSVGLFAGLTGLRPVHIDLCPINGLYDPALPAAMVVPLQWTLAACAVAAALAAWRAGEAMDRATGAPIGIHRKTVGAAALIAMTAIVLGGAAFTRNEGNRAQEKHAAHLLTLTRQAAASIDIANLEQVRPDPQDLQQPAYLHLKHQLTRMCAAAAASRFTYVMRLDDDGETVLFLADSEPHNSEDCSLPGTVYDDASEELRQVLREGGAVVEGPLPDEWGVWVSGLAAIKDVKTGRNVGLIGIDVDAAEFMGAIATARLRAIGLTGMVCLLLLTCAAFCRRIGDHAEALRQSKQKLLLHVEQTMLGLIEMDRDCRVTGWNAAAERIFGHTAEQAIGRSALDLLVPADAREAVDRVLIELINDRKPVRSINTNVTRDGRTITCEWHNTPLVDAGGRIVAIAAMCQDVTQRLAMEQELRNAATVDRLTGLPNRTLFMDRLGQAMRRHRRDPSARFAVLFLDCDRFKIINDSLGHEVGDMLLEQIGLRLAQELRDVDSVSRATAAAAGADDSEDTPHNTAGRLGGDEFVVLLEDLSHGEGAAIVADRLLAAMAKPFVCGGHELFCTASIGIVTSDMGAQRPEDMLRDADTAMYEAKLAGKGRYAVFDVSMRRRVQERHMLENDLRRAVAADPGEQFTLVYQPILNLETGGVESFEVLVRWRHPQRGMISPAEFIPIAEETGLIVELGDWIMREACLHLARWRRLRCDAAPASLSVNLSRRQLIQPDLAERLVEIVAEAGIEPGLLHLEITESAVMQDADHARRVLGDLKAAGFRLDMDDFGTGYSSLACLHQFPLDVLKIDRSFVANLCRGRDFASLVNAIVTLARSLGVAVVAEGVETAEQVLMLQAMDCQYAQGYYFGKPAPIDAAMAYEPAHLPMHEAA